MPKRVSLGCIRRSGLARFFAAFLFALVVAPLTAPFSTFDLAEIQCETLAHADAKDGKTLQDDVCVVCSIAHSVPVLNRVSFAAALRAEPHDVRALGGLVLRI